MGTPKSLQGKLSKASGDRFETFFYTQAVKNQIACIRIPNGMRMIKVRGKLIPVPLATPCDFVLIKNSKSIFIDTKTTVKNSFAYSNLKPHQLEALDLVSRHGCLGGYLIQFNQNESPKVAFFDIKKLLDLKPRSSLCYEEGLMLGSSYEMELNKLFEV